MDNIKTSPADVNHPHSIYGASAAARWRNCPGSVEVIELGKLLGDILPKADSPYAAEGTKAHDYAEKVLTGEMQRGDVPLEFWQHLEGYVNLCKMVAKRAADEDGTTEVEKVVPLFYKPEDVGTADFVGYTAEWLQIIDLKYGAGELVTAQDNDQLAIYCLSVIAAIEAEIGAEFADDFKVALAIYQPRHREFSGEPDVWITDYRELKDIAIDIVADYERAAAGGGEITPSRNACKFCEAKGICKKSIEQGFAGIPAELNPLEDFDDEAKTIELDKTLELDKTGELLLTTEQVGWFVANGSKVKKLVDSIVKAEEARLLAGGDIRCAKLVEGRVGNRTWTDPEAAEKLIKGKLGAAGAYQPRKLITAPKALAALKPMVAAGELSTRFTNKLESLIHRPDGKPTLVMLDDEREALTFGLADDDFADEPECPTPVDDLL